MALENQNIQFKYHDKFMKLCNNYREYTNNLPSHETNRQTAAIIAWALALESEDYEKLPMFWHKAVGTLLCGLRTLDENKDFQNRSDEVTEASMNLLLHLYEKHSKQYIEWHSSEGWSFGARIDFQQCYDVLWTIWNNL